jgi:NADH dehydrogenase
MSERSEVDVVTGAFGYTGKYIARRLLNAGRKVPTLTGHPERPHNLGDRIEIAPLNFRDPTGLESVLRGARVLYNTYWVRFNHGQAGFEEAVVNSRALIQAARAAGVGKIVHLSIANPSLSSHLPYYSGKAKVEKAIIESGLRYAILRPTVISGSEDILINNIAWFIRQFPLFAIPGSGRYELQPIFVEDVAELALREAHNESDRILDAVGPETFTFEDLVRQIEHAVGKSPRLVHVKPLIALQMLRIIGAAVGDVILTKEEIDGLMENLPFPVKLRQVGHGFASGSIKTGANSATSTLLSFGGISGDSRRASVTLTC